MSWLKTMADDNIGRRFVVEGRVQGVYFRASAAREATRLGIRGHAVNLADGRVEVLALGSREALAEMETWLRRGPPAARVDRLLSEAVTSDSCAAVSGFRTG